MIEELPCVNGIALKVAQITHIGGRDSNQDALDEAKQDDLACFVVADGAGGHAGGEIASKIVVKAIIGSFLQEVSFGIRAVQFYVESAVMKVRERKAAEPRLKDMSATVATVLIDQKNSCALWAHMGDTRIYLFRRGKIKAVTKDHSLVQQFIDAGYCSPEQARGHPQRSVLFAAVGAEDGILPEVIEEMVPVEDGDAFLICTDGFWEWVDEDDMEESLVFATTVEEWLSNMQRIAEKNSGNSSKSRDNYTAFAIWLGEPNIITVIR